MFSVIGRFFLKALAYWKWIAIVGLVAVGIYELNSHIEQKIESKILKAHVKQLQEFSKGIQEEQNRKAAEHQEVEKAQEKADAAEDSENTVPESTRILFNELWGE